MAKSKTKPKAKSKKGQRTPIRNIFRILKSPFVYAPLIIMVLVGLGALFYYYNRYSNIIDAGLRGDRFVRSSGIYAAPFKLNEGTQVRMSEVMAHLRSVGYLERGKTDNIIRGQYMVRGDIIEVYPSGDALIDGMKAFRNLRLDFNRNGNFIQSISDLDTRERLQHAELEPELISTVINPEREKRKIIVYKDLPRHLVNAIISIEDRQFFDHPGINWRGILRALIRDYQMGELREGGSSITQQLVKNFFLTPARTPKRKLSEAYMSIILEQKLSKEEIMAMYCNQIYLGQRGGFSINGFGQAARTYFGKDVSNISLHEAALLAGIIRSPNYYSPFTNEERARDRRNLVLEKMVEAGAITRTEAEASKRTSLGIVSKADGIDASDAPYFVDYLMRLTENEVTYGGEPLTSLRVYSTIDLDLQRAAYQAVVRNMQEIDKLVAKRAGGTAGLQAALVALDSKTGEILAMVGGRNYAASQLNRATDARRQPGSVFKPFVYATALELRNNVVGAPITPASMFMDEPKTFEYDGKPYSPGNFGDKYELKQLTVRDALVNSKNVITVEIAQRIGFLEIQRLAERAGLVKLPPYPSMALGVGEATPLQVASAYTAFANQGRRVAPIAIKRVTTKDGVSLFESKIESNEVITPQVSYILTTILQDVLDRGTGTRVRQMGFRETAAGKTGSSRDGWFAGYTPNLVCVVWVGFDDNSDLRLTGGATAAPIWADFMMRALKVRPDLAGEFQVPQDGIVSLDIDTQTGDIAREDTVTRRTELFLQGTEPGAQYLPDYSIPELNTQPGMTQADSPRPPQQPPPEDDSLLTRGRIDDFVPLPPDARRRRVVNPTPTPAPPTRPRPGPTSGVSGPGPGGIPPRPQSDRSFIRRLAEAVGIISTSNAAPQPTPTPWVSAGLGPAGTKEISSTDIPMTPEARSRQSKPEPAKSDNQQAKGPVAPAQKPKPQVAPGQTAKPPAPAVPRPTATPAKESSKETSFVLEVCSVSKLLPEKGLCTKTEKRRFQLGKEPTKFCNSEYHKQD